MTTRLDTTSPIQLMKDIETIKKKTRLRLRCPTNAAEMIKTILTALDFEQTAYIAHRDRTTCCLRFIKKRRHIGFYTT